MPFSGNTTAIDNSTIKQNISGQLYVNPDELPVDGESLEISSSKIRMKKKVLLATMTFSGVQTLSSSVFDASSYDFIAIEGKLKTADLTGSCRMTFNDVGTNIYSTDYISATTTTNLTSQANIVLFLNPSITSGQYALIDCLFDPYTNAASGLLNGISHCRATSFSGLGFYVNLGTSQNISKITIFHSGSGTHLYDGVVKIYGINLGGL